jgi:hypothetical protein
VLKRILLIGVEEEFGSVAYAVSIAVPRKQPGEKPQIPTVQTDKPGHAHGPVP